MKIAQLAPLWKEVPPKKYGGTELIVSLLTEELVKMGHDVVLYACGGSKTAGKLVEIIPQPLFDILGRFVFDSINPYDLMAVKRAFDDAKKGRVDIIHNHMGQHVAALESFSPVPMITTNHSGYKPDFPALSRAAKKSRYISVSDGQRKSIPYLNYIKTIYHGIDTSNFPFVSTPGDYLLFLATMWRDKGVDRAIKIAKKTGMRLIMAGNIREESSDFEDIKDQIDGEQISFIGEVDSEQKKKLFQNALAYLFPIRVNESFGLTVAESLASGTPVIAWPNGSMPEIIIDNVNGYLVESIPEAVEKIECIPNISRQACRDDVVKRFDVSTMAKNYLKLYEDVVAGEY